MPASCLYEGWVRHRRSEPRSHAFRSRLFLVYLDLDEASDLFRDRWLWSVGRVNLASFRREDFLGDPQVPLADAVRDLVKERTGTRPRGPVRLLSHWRYFGYVFNPLSLYFCFDESGEKVEFIVGEVTNTPWKERHCYVLRVPDARRGFRKQTFRTAKQLHVSPFFDMDMEYAWRFVLPGDQALVHIENRVEGRCVFDSTLRLRRREIDGKSLLRVLAAYPAMTARVWAGIHWQAFRLWWKGVPFVPHPSYRSGVALDEEEPPCGVRP
mgnify:CR=1 FL=1